MATMFSLAKSDKCSIFTLVKDGRYYEARIDDKFMKDFIIGDKDMLLELLSDFVESKAEGKITPVPAGINVEISYEQNKKQRFFTIPMRNEEYYIMRRKEELEEKLHKAEADFSTKRIITSPDLEKHLPKLVEQKCIQFIDMKEIDFKSDKVMDLLKAFLMQVYGATCPTMENVNTFLATNKYNIFLTWLSYRSYEKGLHYVYSTGVTKVKNEEIGQANGRVYFYHDPTIWFDYQMTNPSSSNEFVLTTDGLLCMTSIEKAKESLR